MARRRATMVVMACGQVMGAAGAPGCSRSSGTRARSSARSGASDSKPLLQARPALTGYQASGARVGTRPCRPWATRLQPTAQYPHTDAIGPSRTLLPLYATGGFEEVAGG